MKAKIIISVAVVALVAPGVWQWEWDMSGLESWIGKHPVLGAGRFLSLALVVVGMAAVVLVARRLWNAHR